VNIENYPCAKKFRDQGHKNQKIRYIVDMDDLVTIFEVVEKENHGALNKEGQDFIKVTKRAFFVKASFLYTVDINPIQKTAPLVVFIFERNDINPVAGADKCLSVSPDSVVSFVKGIGY